MAMIRAFIYFMLITIGAQAQPDCTLKLDKDSIKVYSCEKKDSKFRSVKSDFMVNSSLSQLAAMLLDIGHYDTWQYKTVSARVLKKISDKEIIYYTEVAAPTPASNRDFVIRLTFEQNPQTREMTIHAVSLPDYLPVKKNIVRVPYSVAQWKVKRISNSRISVAYEILIDLGGAVPPWLVNLLAHQAPYQTFKDLKEQIGKYRNSKIEFIKD